MTRRWDLPARLLERPLTPRRGGGAPPEPRDAIVVLGAPLAADGGLTEVLAERVRAAAALYHAGGAPRVVVTGGVTRRGHPAEAEVMAAALAAAAVPDVLVEAAARSTHDNAVLVARLLAPLAAHRVWLVTQPFHGRRAIHLFRGAGLDARAWHIEDSLQYQDRRRAVRWLVREYVAWAALAVRAAGRGGR